MAHSSNYHSTLIAIAPDCAATTGVVPPKPDSVAGRHHAMLTAAPYSMTSDDLLFAVHAARNGLPETAEHRAEFFAKPKACLRASPLPKQYGWGIHHDAEGRIALYAVGSADYVRLQNDPRTRTVAAVRSKRA
ncbi:MAG: DUF6157 family protein [Sphingopyxis sp.]|uniref:DUF6157 family protein n=1 Tax=Sphingopyxis sp. TaxID=1908224 RepID=UPI002ABB86EE|nr:DUF6157 family protein [Sphingopyxis sp.]MDZ3831065.1 DUF6157 family protein [Sphingopyxis sp.]